MHAADFRTLPISNIYEANTVYGTPYLTGSTIASGATASGVIDAGKMLPMNITCPANLEGVSTLTIEHSDKQNGTFTQLWGTLNNGSTGLPFTITLLASTTIPLDTSIIQGLGYIKLIPNTAPSADLVLKIGGKQAA